MVLRGCRSGGGCGPPPTNMLKWHVYKKQRLAVQYITYAAKQTQLRDREATLKLQLDGVDRGKDENAELAGKVFERPGRLQRERQHSTMDAPSDAGYNPNNLYHNSLAHYVLPSVNEWYKAAYYNPTSGVYYDYPTGSNSVPDGIDVPGDLNFEPYLMMAAPIRIRTTSPTWEC